MNVKTSYFKKISDDRGSRNHLIVPSIQHSKTDKSDQVSAPEGCRIQDLCAEDRAKLGRLILELASAQQALAMKHHSVTKSEFDSLDKSSVKSSITRDSCTLKTLTENRHTISRTDEQSLSRMASRTDEPDAREENSNWFCASRSIKEQTQMLSIVTSQQLQIHEINSQLKKVTHLLAKVKSDGSGKASMTADTISNKSDPESSTRSASVACQTMKSAERTQSSSEQQRITSSAPKIRRNSCLTKQMKKIVHQQLSINKPENPSRLEVNAAHWHVRNTSESNTQNGSPSRYQFASSLSPDDMTEVLSVIELLDTVFPSNNESVAVSPTTQAEDSSQVSHSTDCCENRIEADIINDLFFLDF